MKESEKTLHTALVPTGAFALIFFGVLYEHIVGRMNVPTTGNIISCALPLLLWATHLLLKSQYQEKRGE